MKLLGWAGSSVVQSLGKRETWAQKHINTKGRWLGERSRDHFLSITEDRFQQSNGGNQENHPEDKDLGQEWA